MKSTEFKVKEKNVSYEAVSDGYDIYLGGKKWISQHEPNIPDTSLSYEENCLKQIEELCSGNDDTTEETISDRISLLESAIEDLASIVGGE